MPIELEISPRGEKVGEKITLNAGKTTFKEDGLDELFQAALKAGIKFTTEYQKTDMYIVGVPTPYDKFSKKVDAWFLVGDYPQLAKVIDESMKTFDPFFTEKAIVKNQLLDFDQFLSEVDMVVIMVKHDHIKQNWDKLKGKVVLDCHNICPLPDVYHI